MANPGAARHGLTSDCVISAPGPTCQRKPTGAAVNDHFHKYHELARRLTLSAIVFEWRIARS